MSVFPQSKKTENSLTDSASETALFKCSHLSALQLIQRRVCRHEKNVLCGTEVIRCQNAVLKCLPSRTHPSDSLCTPTLHLMDFTCSVIQADVDLRFDGVKVNIHCTKNPSIAVMQKKKLFTRKITNPKDN